MNPDFDIIRRIAAKNGLHGDLPIQRYGSGIANRAYALGHNYVVKLEGDWKGVLAHQKEVADKLLSVGAKVSRILDSGTIGETPYLLMEKLPGTNLVYDWFKFDMKQKEHFIAQIADELKKFHSIKFGEYAICIASAEIAPGVCVKNLKDAITRITDFGAISRNELEFVHRFSIEFLEKFYRKNLAILDETGTAVLVHNDLHLENVFYENDEITGIIDFDWVAQAPKDYELWKIIEVFRAPKYAVEKELEPLYENYQMKEEFGFLKKYYPELFEAENLPTRIRLFYLQKTIERIVYCQSGKPNTRTLDMVELETNDIYKTKWLEEWLAM